MKKFLALLLCTAPIIATSVTIKNDTKVDYFITCDELGYLINPQKEVQLDVAEVNWLKSWWHDPSVITLYKKIGESEEFAKVFYLTPKSTDDNTITIFMSDVLRKARHVSAPFSVKAINSPSSAEEK